MRTVIPLLLTACATSTSSTPRGGPRGLHAEDHLELARHHDQMAREVSRPPDRVAEGQMIPVAWVRSWNPAAEHERLAAAHRSSAAALEAAYEEGCGDRTLADVAVSPLVRYAESGWNTQTGVIMYLSPLAGPPDRLLADIKCHRAWMLLSRVENMDDCPLDLPGIVVDARGEGQAITVSIGVRDPALVEELHRRVGRDLEKGMQFRRDQ